MNVQISGQILVPVLACSVGVFGVFLGQPAIAATTVLADSSDDFSAVQGEGNWYYGYYTDTEDSTSFQQLPSSGETQDDGVVWGGLHQGDSVYYSPWLSAQKGAPDSDPVNGNPYMVVRRWVSDVTASISVSGMFGDVNSVGDGVLGQIFLDLDPADNDPANKVLEIQSAGTDLLSYLWEGDITAGSYLDFAIHPNINGNVSSDSARFTATIAQNNATAVPTPALLPGLIGFGASLLRRRQRQRMG